MADPLRDESNKNFLKRYKLSKCLWDADDPLYSNQEERRKAYEELAESTNISVLDVKEKIQFFRSTYCCGDGTLFNELDDPLLLWFIETHKDRDHIAEPGNNDDLEMEITSIDEWSVAAVASDAPEVPRANRRLTDKDDFDVEVVTTEDWSTAVAPTDAQELPSTSRRTTDEASAHKKKKKKHRKLKRLRKVKKDIRKDKDEEERAEQTKPKGSKRKEKKKKLKKKKRTEGEFEQFGRTISSELQNLPKILARRTMKDIRNQLESLRIQVSEQSSALPIAIQASPNNTSDDINALSDTFETD